jgi:nucleotide-binding universal stress UspA family protein
MLQNIHSILASHVELVSVTGEKDLEPAVFGADLAPHLTRHGIKAGELTLPALDGGVAETLRNHADLIRADMIVMGAYVHSRLRQMMLGGTTRSLLKNCPAPLFLSY